MILLIYKVVTVLLFGWCSQMAGMSGAAATGAGAGAGAEKKSDAPFDIKMDATVPIL